MPAQVYIVASGAKSSGRGPATRGLQNIQTAHCSLGVAPLVQHASRHGVGEPDGKVPPMVRAGQCTGRSPNGTRVVRHPLAGRCVQWVCVNQAISEARFTGPFRRMQSFWRGGEIYVEDSVVGADAEGATPNYAIGAFVSRRVLAIAAAAPSM